MKRSRLLKLLGVLTILGAAAVFVFVGKGGVCQVNGDTECRLSDPAAATVSLVVAAIGLVAGVVVIVLGVMAEVDER